MSQEHRWEVTPVPWGHAMGVQGKRCISILHKASQCWNPWEYEGGHNQVCMGMVTQMTEGGLEGDIHSRNR